MGKLAEHTEEAFSFLDNGDIISFTKRIADIADFSVQSKKHRKAFDEFVEEHFKLRKDLVEDFQVLVLFGGKENGSGESGRSSKSGAESELETSSVSGLPGGSTKRRRPRPPKRERMQQ